MLQRLGVDFARRRTMRAMAFGFVVAVTGCSETALRDPTHATLALPVDATSITRWDDSSFAVLSSTRAELLIVTPQGAPTERIKLGQSLPSRGGQIYPDVVMRVGDRIYWATRSGKRPFELY
jgi:hypothetical protein